MRTPRRKTCQPKHSAVNTAYESFDSKWKASRFAMFMTRTMSEYWECSLEEACHRLNEIGELENDLIRFYDVLHTQGTGYLIPDIDRKWKEHHYVRPA